MNADSHYIIGSTHEVCQDYACSNQEDFAVLSDGCSNVIVDNKKLKNSYVDIGARILCHSALIYKNYLKYAISICSELDLGPENMTATLLTLSGNKLGCMADVYGDGLVAGRIKETGKFEIHKIEQKPYPYYPIHPSESEWIINGVNIGIQEGFVLNFNWEIYDLVVAMSDGAFSFNEDVIDTLLDFRSTIGKFVVRHLRGVTRELAAKNIKHYDDISMVAIYNA